MIQEKEVLDFLKKFNGSKEELVSHLETQEQLKKEAKRDAEIVNFRKQVVEQGYYVIKHNSTCKDYIKVVNESFWAESITVFLEDKQFYVKFDKKQINHLWFSRTDLWSNSSNIISPITKEQYETILLKSKNTISEIFNN